MVDYWGLFRNITKIAVASQCNLPQKSIRSFDGVQLPLKEETAIKGDYYLNPAHHEGVDLFLADNPNSFGSPSLLDVNLIADGSCVYTGFGAMCANGYLAIFKHQQEDGAEILSLYGHLAELGNLTVGAEYRKGYRLGSIQTRGPLGEGYLHFSVAYGATWDTVLKNTPVLSTSIQPNWIRRRFLSPLEYLQSWDHASRLNQTPR
jgi:hypothetical protein